MRFTEIIGPEDQLALWKLVSDSVWTSISIQAKQEARAKAAKKRKATAKRTKPTPAHTAPPFRAPPIKAQNAVNVAKAPASTTPIRPQTTQPISGTGSIGASIGPKVVGQNNPTSNGTGV